MSGAEDNDQLNGTSGPGGSDRQSGEAVINGVGRQCSAEWGGSDQRGGEAVISKVGRQ
jgi:hypothetical protein